MVLAESDPVAVASIIISIIAVLISAGSLGISWRQHAVSMRKERVNLKAWCQPCWHSGSHTGGMHLIGLRLRITNEGKKVYPSSIMLPMKNRTAHDSRFFQPISESWESGMSYDYKFDPGILYDEYGPAAGYVKILFRDGSELQVHIDGLPEINV